MTNNWKKFVPACVAGNILELYEFMIYGYFAANIGNLFFPLQNKYSSLLAAFAVFSTGSIIRPFSAVIMGYIGDKLGRRFSLIISIGIMSICTLGIGLLPTYSHIGIVAPILLILFRAGQGVSMTGEEIGAALYLMENAPLNEKGYSSSFILASVFIGLFFGSIISALIFAVLDEPELSAWGWRLPFILGGTLGLVTLHVRIKQPESLEFNNALSNNALIENPLINLFKQNKISVLRSMLFCSLFATAIYLFAVYIPNTLNIDKHHTMFICSICFITAFFISLAIGKLVDKVNPTTPILISAIGFLLLSYPIFYLLTSNSWVMIIFSYLLFAVLLGFSAGSTLYQMTQIFPVNTRFSGSCIAFNLSMSIFGGTAPLLALYLTKHFHAASPAFILIITSSLTLFSVLTENANYNETYDQELTYGNQINSKNGQ